ncbi:hypothetical protein LX36DRAFT_672676 [Colletotrichum falcatum]|nr:hypothetical protein LX36DRAFT_672676 [Colletotrichum falcatum]
MDISDWPPQVASRAEQHNPATKQGSPSADQGSEYGYHHSLTAFVCNPASLLSLIVKTSLPRLFLPNTTYLSIFTYAPPPSPPCVTSPSRHARAIESSSSVSSRLPTLCVIADLTVAPVAPFSPT